MIKREYLRTPDHITYMIQDKTHFIEFRSQYEPHDISTMICLCETLSDIAKELKDNNIRIYVTRK